MISAMTTLAWTDRTKTIQRPQAGVLLVTAGVCWALASPSPAAASQALAQRYACIACHQPAARTVGPSWREISARYGVAPEAVAQLAASIKAGSTGKWGAMPMPPQMQVSDADAQTLAQWLIDGAK